MPRNEQIFDACLREADFDAAPVRVVVGFDGSMSSRHALAWGCGEAVRLGGAAIAVFVTRDRTWQAFYSGAVGLDGTAHEHLAQAVSAHWEQVRGEVLDWIKQSPCDLQFVHRHGDPANELLLVATDARANVIAIGQSHRTLRRSRSVSRRLHGLGSGFIVAVVP